MAAGLPVIGADVPTIRRVLTEHDCGLTVDAAVPEEIAAAVMRIIEEPHLRARLGENGRRAVRDYFNSVAEESRLADAIAAAAACSPAGPPAGETAAKEPQCALGS
jgi:glycosyltransferase involved in cell wall biosynthesis